MNASFCAAKQYVLQFFQTKDYKISKSLEDRSFILYLSCLSKILAVLHHCNCYLQWPGSNIIDFAIKLTTSGVGKVRLASHTRLFGPRDVARQLFWRNTEDLFCFAIALKLLFPALWSKTYFALSSPICISYGVEDIFAL